jgi:glycosyltransferase involved in cell wall biosynthesis
MRILHVTPYYRDAWAYGGIPRVVTALAEAQAARGHEVTVWTTDAGTQVRASMDTRHPTLVNGVTVHAFRNVSNSLAYHAQAFLPLGFRTHAAREARPFDVAHLHACRNLPGAWAAHALGNAGVPYVVAPHGTAPVLERFSFAKRVFDRAYGDDVIGGAARVVAVSEAERRQLLALGIASDRICVVGNPVAISEFERPAARGRFREAMGCNGQPLVLFLGKMTPRKRLDVLVDAFALLEPRTCTLVIAGNDMGSGDDTRARVRARGIEERVRFAGLLQGSDRLQALGDADVVVYPGEHEVFGLVAIEAVLCGTPVVVAGDSGCGEVIGSVGGGEVVPAGDAPALSAAVSSMLVRRSAWVERVACARRTIRQRFDVNVIAEAMEEVYAGARR